MIKINVRSLVVNLFSMFRTRFLAGFSQFEVCIGLCDLKTVQ